MAAFIAKQVIGSKLKEAKGELPPCRPLQLLLILLLVIIVWVVVVSTTTNTLTTDH